MVYWCKFAANWSLLFAHTHTHTHTRAQPLLACTRNCNCHFASVCVRVRNAFMYYNFTFYPFPKLCSDAVTNVAHVASSAAARIRSTSTQPMSKWSRVSLQYRVPVAGVAKWSRVVAPTPWTVSHNVRFANWLIWPIQSHCTDYDLALQRMCVQRGPDDNMDRCADTIYNHKKVFMCFCQGDLCNAAVGQRAPLRQTLLVPIVATLMPIFLTKLYL